MPDSSARPSASPIPGQSSRSPGAATDASRLELRAYACPAPGCGWEGEFDPAFVAWCRACGHNAQPATDTFVLDEKPKKTAKRRRREAAETERALRLYEELAAGADARPESRLRWAVAAFSVAVHVPFVLLLSGAATWLAVQPGNWFAWLGALIAVCLAGAVRPRFGRGPRGGGWYRRDDFPELFALLDRVAAAVGAEPPVAVAFTGAVNASTARVGLRRQRVLVIGIPLWTILAGPERVALLAHEMGHQVNGDATHGTLAYSAQASLAEWEAILDPRGARNSNHDGTGLGGIVFVAHLLLPVILFPFYVAVRGLRLLHGRIWTASRPRAEYLADAIAARVASTDAAVALLDKAVLADTAANFLTRHGSKAGTDLWGDLYAYVDGLPEHERERLRFNDEATGAAVDSTHPPTHLRRKLLAEAAPVPAELAPTDAEWAKVDGEMALVGEALARDLRLM